MGDLHFLIIDPQNDFCSPEGSLFVPGAPADMERLAALIKCDWEIIDNITVTLDTHNVYHIAHPLFWEDEKGRSPEAFTIITSEDVEKGRWKAADPASRSWARRYVKLLEKNGRYALCVWPEHCVAGTWGSCVYQPLQEALSFYERKKLKGADYIFKSRNPLTEHYSALRADVPVCSDPGTFVNKDLLLKAERAANIIVAGEALSHCVANTVTDMGEALGGDLSGFILLEDASSPVKGFENLGESFLEKARTMGMMLSSSENYKGALK